MRATACSTLRANFLACAAALFASSSALAWTPEQPVRPYPPPPPGQIEWVQVITDGSGGTYICWGDKRHGNWDVFVQHLSASGTPVSGWPLAGLDVSPVLGDQERPRIVSDGVGGVIVCWEDSRHTQTGKDIFAQRLTSAGERDIEWPVDGAQVCNEIGDQDNTRVVSDGASGAIIVWRDKRNPSEYRFFAQRMNSAGAALWSSYGPNGMPASPGLYEANWDPVILDVSADAASGAILAYIDGSARLTAQRLAGADGATQWNPNGYPVPGIVLSSSAAIFGYGSPISVAADGQGGAYVAYTHAGTTADIYMQHVDSEGSPWVGDGTLLCNAAFDQFDPRVASDGVDGAVACWVDWRANRFNSPDIYAQRVTSTGEIAMSWPSNGVAIASATGHASPGAITTDGRGGAVIGWDVSPGNLVKGRRVSKEAVLDAAIQLATTGGAAPSIARVANGKAVAAWKDLRSPTSNTIYAQELPYDGTPPASVSDLRAILRCNNILTLRWTTPGDDGVSGTATAYDLRYSLSPIDEANFGSLPQAETPGPGNAGTPEQAELLGLQMCSLYYFALKTRDEVFNWSALSNIGAASTTCNPGQCLPRCQGLCGTDKRVPGGRTEGDAPDRIEFALPAPNPSGQESRIEYAVPTDQAGADLDLSVFDVAGRRLRTLAHGTVSPGRFTETWDLMTDQGARVPPGTYYLRLRVGSTILRRVIVALP